MSCIIFIIILQNENKRYTINNFYLLLSFRPLLDFQYVNREFRLNIKKGKWNDEKASTMYSCLE